ncbi:hypothetical protein MPQ_0013 [Methylovorus sp. MP688]|nr:hypothetical protein MPQ_0013 [Methylovorus sp. MP688]
MLFPLFSWSLSRRRYIPVTELMTQELIMQTTPYKTIPIAAECPI